MRGGRGSFSRGGRGFGKNKNNNNQQQQQTGNDSTSYIPAGINWHSPDPPPDYVPGRGRGDEGFSTGAELRRADDAVAKEQLHLKKLREQELQEKNRKKKEQEEREGGISNENFMQAFVDSAASASATAAASSSGNNNNERNSGVSQAYNPPEQNQNNKKHEKQNNQEDEDENENIFQGIPLVKAARIEAGGGRAEKEQQRLLESAEANDELLPSIIINKTVSAKSSNNNNNQNEKEAKGKAAARDLAQLISRGVTASASEGASDDNVENEGVQYSLLDSTATHDPREVERYKQLILRRIETSASSSKSNESNNNNSNNNQKKNNNNKIASMSHDFMTLAQIEIIQAGMELRAGFDVLARGTRMCPESCMLWIAAATFAKKYIKNSKLALQIAREGITKMKQLFLEGRSFIPTITSSSSSNSSSSSAPNKQQVQEELAAYNFLLNLLNLALELEDEESANSLGEESQNNNNQNQNQHQQSSSSSSSPLVQGRAELLQTAVTIAPTHDAYWEQLFQVEDSSTHREIITGSMQHLRESNIPIPVSLWLRLAHMERALLEDILYRSGEEEKKEEDNKKNLQQKQQLEEDHFKRVKRVIQAGLNDQKLQQQEQQNQEHHQSIDRICLLHLLLALTELEQDGEIKCLSSLSNSSSSSSFTSANWLNSCLRLLSSPSSPSFSSFRNKKKLTGRIEAVVKTCFSSSSSSESPDSFTRSLLQAVKSNEQKRKQQIESPFASKVTVSSRVFACRLEQSVLASSSNALDEDEQNVVEEEDFFSQASISLTKAGFESLSSNKKNNELLLVLFDSLLNQYSSSLTTHSSAKYEVIKNLLGFFSSRSIFRIACSHFVSWIKSQQKQEERGEEEQQAIKIAIESLKNIKLVGLDFQKRQKWIDDVVSLLELHRHLILARSGNFSEAGNFKHQSQNRLQQQKQNQNQNQSEVKQEVKEEGDEIKQEEEKHHQEQEQQEEEFEDVFTECLSHCAQAEIQVLKNNSAQNNNNNNNNNNVAQTLVQNLASLEVYAAKLALPFSSILSASANSASFSAHNSNSPVSAVSKAVAISHLLNSVRLVRWTVENNFKISNLTWEQIIACKFSAVDRKSDNNSEAEDEYYSSSSSSRLAVILDSTLDARTCLHAALTSSNQTVTTMKAKAILEERIRNIEGHLDRSLEERDALLRQVSSSSSSTSSLSASRRLTACLARIQYRTNTLCQLIATRILFEKENVIERGRVIDRFCNNSKATWKRGASAAFSKTVSSSCSSSSSQQQKEQHQISSFNRIDPAVALSLDLFHNNNNNSKTSLFKSVTTTAVHSQDALIPLFNFFPFDGYRCPLPGVDLLLRTVVDCCPSKQSEPATLKQQLDLANQLFGSEADNSSSSILLPFPRLMLAANSLFSSFGKQDRAAKEAFKALDAFFPVRSFSHHSSSSPFSTTMFSAPYSSSSLLTNKIADSILSVCAARDEKSAQFVKEICSCSNY